MAELNGAIDDPATLLKALDRLRKDFDARTVRGYFQSLAALMRSAIKRGPAIHRTREAQEETELAPLPVQEDEHDGDGVQITGGFAPQLPAFAGPLDEQRVDRPPVSQTMRGRDDPEDYSSPRTAKLRAQRAERASARRELSLSAEQDPLTAHEVAVLTNWLRDNPFEFYADFDLEAGLLWVSDKTGRGARGTRMLPLAPRAIAQVNAWIAHLERLGRRLSLTHPDQAALVRAALSMGEETQGPFVLYFDAKGDLVPLRPKIQETSFEPVLPTALNRTRHILRSALVGRFGPAAIDAFLGHGHIGEDPFVADSSLGLRDLWPVADAIEDLLIALGAVVVESPL